jgi:hypothetical protein
MPTSLLSGSRAGVGSAVLTSTSVSLTAQIVGVGTVFGPGVATIPPILGHLNFPDNPITGQIFTQSGMKWIWDGVKWIGINQALAISDTAPSTPANGQFWFDSINARLYIYYADPNTSQWVGIA